MPTTATEPTRYRGVLARAFGEALTEARLRPLLDAPRAPLAAPAADRSWWGRAHAPTLAAMRAEAEREANDPWPQPLASDFAAYFRDGNRTRYERAIAARSRRLSRVGVLAAATRDTAWIDATVDGICLTLDEATWCWAAHDDVHTRSGECLPDPERPYLDLGAGEIAAQLAYLDAIAGADLEARAPGLRARVRRAVRERVFAPFETRPDWHWLGLDGDVHNWNPWILGNLIAAAWQLETDADRAACLIATALSHLDRYASALPADGAIDEGFAYWWNGACRLLECLDLLRRVLGEAGESGGTLDASLVPSLRATLAFPRLMHLGGDWFVNVADGPARGGHHPWHVLHRLAVAGGDAPVAEFARSQRGPGAGRAGGAASTDGATDGATGGATDFAADVAAGLGRFLGALGDTAWHDPADPADPANPADPATPPPLVDLPSVGISLHRHPGVRDGFALLVKGGHNGEHHNHLDVGHVSVACAGVPVLVDAGQPTYTAQTFGPQRYEIRAMRSEWHSTLAPAGREQGVGSRFAARDRVVTAAGARLDVSDAYELPPGRALLRDARVGASAVEVIDTWSLDGPAEVRYLIAGACTLADGRVAITPLGGGRTLELTWATNAPVAATLDEWRLDDDLLRRSWGGTLTRLTVTLGAESGTCRTTLTYAKGQR